MRREQPKRTEFGFALRRRLISANPFYRLKTLLKAS
jgi:hypothetical protein